MGDCLFGVAAIQRLGPHQGVGKGRIPDKIARAGRDASYRDGISEWECGDRRNEFTVSVADGDVLGKIAGGDQPGEWPLDFYHQQVLSVWGGADLLVETRPPDSGPAASS